MKDKNCQFQLKQLTLQELRNIVLTSKSSNSAGTDMISIRILKTVLREIEKPLLRLVNQSILTKKYPESLKTAKTIPIYKTAVPPKPLADPKSYRGINILSTP